MPPARDNAHTPISDVAEKLHRKKMIPWDRLSNCFVCLVVPCLAGVVIGGIFLSNGPLDLSPAKDNGRHERLPEHCRRMRSLPPATTGTLTTGARRRQYRALLHTRAPTDTFTPSPTMLMVRSTHPVKRTFCSHIQTRAMAFPPVHNSLRLSPSAPQCRAGVQSTPAR